VRAKQLDKLAYLRYDYIIIIFIINDDLSRIKRKEEDFHEKHPVGS